MKKILLTAWILTLFLSGCVTVPQPVQNQFPIGIGYKVLGRVTLDGVSRKHGYIALIKKAKKEFPESDDVINIYIDRLDGGCVPAFSLTGIAIQYEK